MKEFDLSTYPTSCGVYLMQDATGEVLYVGKAKNLRKRLSQYFHGEEEKRALIKPLLEKLFHIEFIVTNSEKEALLLENTLIKEKKPKYNILLKDDKSFICLMISKHKWPQIQVVRKKVLKDGHYFGPYTNARAARVVLDLLLRLFQLRQCSDGEFASRKRPCLLYDLKKCLAPCVGKCDEKSYLENVEQAKSFLKGQDREILKSLKQEMKRASEALEFERAADVLHKIQMIEHVLQLQGVENVPLKNSHVLGVFQKNESITIALLIYKRGKLLASEHFSFSFVVAPLEEILESFIIQHYKNKELPEEILVPFSVNAALLTEVLRDKHKVHIFVPKMGAKKRALELASHNAESIFEKENSSIEEPLLLQLQESLELNRYPRKIECFDTSHTSDKEVVASLVTYINGKKDKSKTRLFKIRRKEKGDLNYLEEVLWRHYSREKEHKEFCDLLIIDGGKTHLKLALKVLDKLDIATIDVIALAKEEGRHDRGLTQEKIFLPHKDEPLLLSLTSPQLFLLQKIRDEAHRVAITFHRKRRSLFNVNVQPR